MPLNFQRKMLEIVLLNRTRIIFSRAELDLIFVKKVKKSDRVLHRN